MPSGSRRHHKQSFHGRLGGIERPPMATGSVFNATTRVAPPTEGPQTTKPTPILENSETVSRVVPSVSVQRPSEPEQTQSTTPGMISISCAVRLTCCLVIDIIAAEGSEEPPLFSRDDVDQIVSAPVVVPPRQPSE